MLLAAVLSARAGKLACRYPPVGAQTPNETLRLGNAPWRFGTNTLQDTCPPHDSFDPYRIAPDFIPSANSSLPKGIFAAIARLILADQQDHAAKPGDSSAHRSWVKSCPKRERKLPWSMNSSETPPPARRPTRAATNEEASPFNVETSPPVLPWTNPSVRSSGASGRLAILIRRPAVLWRPSSPAPSKVTRPARRSWFGSSSGVSF